MSVGTAFTIRLLAVAAVVVMVKLYVLWYFYYRTNRAPLSATVLQLIVFTNEPSEMMSLWSPEYR